MDYNRRLSFVSFCAAAAALLISSNSRAEWMTSHGSDTVDGSPRVHVYRWGWLNNTSVNPDCYTEYRAQLSNSYGASYGAGGTRWMGDTPPYPGYDYNSGTYVNPNNNSGLLVDETDDTHNPPSGSITDSTVLSEVQYLISSGQYTPSTKDDILLLLLPPQVNGLSVNNIAASGYHSNSGSVFNYDLFATTMTPADCNPTNNTYANFSATIQHEIEETMTDPISGDGWYDSSDGNEIGDFCSNNAPGYTYFTVQTQPRFSPTGGDPWNMLVGAQTFWSNEQNKCVYARQPSVYLFGLGTDNNLWMQYDIANTLGQSIGYNNWMSWGNPGTSLVGKPGAAAWGPNRTDVFVLGTDRNMYHAYSDSVGLPNTTAYWGGMDAPQSGNWWSTNGFSSPDAASWGAGNVTAIAWEQNILSGAYSLVADTWDGRAWTNWESLSTTYAPSSKISAAGWGATPMYNVGNPGSDLEAALLAYVTYYNNASQIVVGKLTYAADGDVLSATWQNPYLPNFNGAYPVDLDVATLAPGGFDIFVRDSAGNMWDCWSNDGGYTIYSCTNYGAPSSSIGGALTQGNDVIGAVGLGDGRWFVGARGGDGNGVVAFYDDGSWTGWTRLPQSGAFNSGIDAATW